MTNQAGLGRIKHWRLCANHERLCSPAKVQCLSGSWLFFRGSVVVSRNFSTNPSTIKIGWQSPAQQNVRQAVRMEGSISLVGWNNSVRMMPHLTPALASSPFPGVERLYYVVRLSNGTTASALYDWTVLRYSYLVFYRRCLSYLYDSRSGPRPCLNYRIQPYKPRPVHDVHFIRWCLNMLQAHV
jgi:hypothetical protein